MGENRGEDEIPPGILTRGTPSVLGTGRARKFRIWAGTLCNA